MGKGGRRKVWPRSWKQPVHAGAPILLKGRSIEREYVVVAAQLEADAPEQLAEMVERALVAECGRQRPS